MQRNVFLAGAAGAIGSRLGPMLVAAGYAVSGTTRSPERALELESKGVTPILVNVFDRDALIEAVVRCAPSVVIHQLTDLPNNLDPALMNDAVVKNARIRREGTRNLVDAALAASCPRIIAQSIAWAYAPSTLSCKEEAELDTHATGARKISIDGVIALETCLLTTPGLVTTLLRYGQLYGPGTAHLKVNGSVPIHIDAAAHAAILALKQDASGIFNITEDSASVSNHKARAILGWTPDFRL
ncbi:nucleoside-diphosphate-sugar epimerase [Herbaspirillum sp. Sphag1AN]|uniref:NAD-dependent epimerase/dehydratase family protein n=1 Tax=unclassified Herbaspirillum TaxID=2624150 RepID=UPI00160F7BFD|nr:MULTISPECIES: NAD(P)-dependent oxidoreductase [unclassified Herbaspirillum]MBB3211517.1 nucleoside-diphosphate-sugar epimerase [Herbaspirillum sp. Sphag1AN]MBB3245217.1 nucleoside-diphosphate-sugar epimerase [Herbaspirillum sp. Sphag64]